MFVPFRRPCCLPGVDRHSVCNLKTKYIFRQELLSSSSCFCLGLMLLVVVVLLSLSHLYSLTKGPQIFPIRVESFGKDKSDVVLAWTQKEQVIMTENLTVSQFSIEANPSESCLVFYLF